MKKSFSAAFVFLMIAVTTFAAEKPFRRFDFSLSVSYAGSSIGGSSSVQSRWNTGAYLDIQDESITTVQAGTSWLPAGSLSYYFGRHLGVQVRIGSLANEATTSSIVSFSNTREGATTMHRESWSGSASYRSMPLSLNLVVGRLGGDRLQFAVSAGATYFMNSFQGAGYAGVSIYLNDAVDGYKIPTIIKKKTWNEFGLNIGASAAWRLSDAISLMLEGRYYYCQPMSFTWQYTPGVYTSLYGSPITVIEYPYVAPVHSVGQTQYKLNPSFYCLGAGILITF